MRVQFVIYNVKPIRYSILIYVTISLISIGRLRRENQGWLLCHISRSHGMVVPPGELVRTCMYGGYTRLLSWLDRFLQESTGEIWPLLAKDSILKSLQRA